MPLDQGHTGDKLTESGALAVPDLWPDALSRMSQQLSRETSHLSLLPAWDIFPTYVGQGKLLAEAVTTTPKRLCLDPKQICFLLTSLWVGGQSWGGEDPAPHSHSGRQGPSTVDSASFYA